jgi:hypothetical protein
MVTLAIAMSYYRWGPWRTVRLVEVTPHGETPDPGQAPPTGIEETEVQAAEVLRLKASQT